MNKVQRWRLALGISRRRIAAYLRVSMSAYTQWELGRRKWPREIAFKLVKLALDFADLVEPITVNDLLQQPKAKETKRGSPEWRAHISRARRRESAVEEK
jgi:transcriptional regulator with XRE-family HTH domain